MGATGGEDAHTTVNVGIGLTTVVGRGGERGKVGVEVLVAGGDEDIDGLKVLLGVRVVLELGVELAEEGVAGVVAGEDAGAVARGNGAAFEIDIEGVAVLGIVEADEGLVEARVLHHVPHDVASATAHEAEDVVVGGFADEFLGGLADEGDAVGGGHNAAGGGVEHFELVAFVAVEGVGGVVERLGDRGELSVGPRGDGIGEGDGVATTPVVESQEAHDDGVLGIVDGVADGAVGVDISLAEEALFHTHPGGVVVLVEEAMDDGDLLPGGVGREIDLAGGEEQQGCYRN